MNVESKNLENYNAFGRLPTPLEIKHSLAPHLTKDEILTYQVWHDTLDAKWKLPEVVLEEILAENAVEVIGFRLRNQFTNEVKEVRVDDTNLQAQLNNLLLMSHTLKNRKPM